VTQGWPYPGDSPVARARRVARAYREVVARLDPDACAELDERLAGWGETWLAPRIVTYDLDDWLSAAQAADVAAVSVACLRQWRGRDRLRGRQVGGRWEYRARDVLTLAAEVRRRGGSEKPLSEEDH